MQSINVSDTHTVDTQDKHSITEFFVVGLCFLLSGFAALVYETAWSQQLSLVFGSSDLAIAAVLAAYMAGLAIGSALMSRYIQRIQKPLLVYAIIELGIALTAILVPTISSAMNHLQPLLLGVNELSAYSPLHSTLFYLAAAFLILLPPTCLMGATLPLLAKYLVRKERQLGSRIGLLYMINTTGAAGGALVTAFVLLPNLGLGRTSWVAVSVNLLAFIIAALWYKNFKHEQSVIKPTPDEIETTPTEQRSLNQWILPAIMLSGFVSLSYEVLWTRLLSHVLGGSIYAFGIMLAIFLFGLSFGAGIAGRYAKTVERARAGFVVIQLCIAISFALTFSFADLLTKGDSAPDFGGLAFLLYSLRIGFLTLLPGALFIGASFPFAVRIYANNRGQAAFASARVYAWNTIGAIFGAIICGFFLLPILKITATTQLLVLCSLFLALFSCIAMPPIKKAWAISTVVVMVLLAWLPMHTPWDLLRSSPLPGSVAQGEVEFYEVGRGATVLLTDIDGDLRLTTNGLPESAIQRKGARVDQYGLARWLSMLPVVSRPEAEKMLVIGFGAGITVSAAPPSLVSIDVVELEPMVIAASAAYAYWREEDPLSDPRVNIHINDARSALQASQERFDIIVSQPSHPWTSGASNLFTREFFSLVDQHLNTDGVYVQWIGSRFINEALLKSLLATLQVVFPHVELYQPNSGGGLVFMASQAPLMMDVPGRMDLPFPSDWRLIGVDTREELLIARRLDAEGAKALAYDGELSTDSYNLMRMRSPRALANSLSQTGLEPLLSTYDPMQTVTDQRQDLYIIRELILQNASLRARSLVAKISDPVLREIGESLIALTVSGQQLAARQNLLRLLQEHPGHTEIISALFVLNHQAIIQKSAPSLLQDSVHNDPVANLIKQGLIQNQLQDRSRDKYLDQQLIAIPVSHPLYSAGARLRIFMQMQHQDIQHRLQALRLLDELLAKQVLPNMLLQRTSLALASNQHQIALASLYELYRQLKRNPQLPAQLHQLALALLDQQLENNEIQREEIGTLKRLINELLTQKLNF